MAGIECVANVHALLGEGPVWVAREAALYWLDIKGRKIFRLDEHGHLTEWPTPMRIGSIAPKKSGGFIAGTEDGIALVDPATDRFEIVLNSAAHLPDTRFHVCQVELSGPYLLR